MDEIEEPVICSGCGGVAEDPTRLEGWTETEYGYLCKECAPEEAQAAEAAREQDVQSLVGHTDLIERILLDGLAPDAPREVKEAALASLRSGAPEPEAS